MLVIQSCLTLSDPVDCSPPGSSVHGILQARILEWGAISRVSSWPRDQTQLSCLAGRFFTVWASRGDQQSQAQNVEVQKDWENSALGRRGVYKGFTEEGVSEGGLQEWVRLFQQPHKCKDGSPQTQGSASSADVGLGGQEWRHVDNGLVGRSGKRRGWDGLRE